MYFPAKRKLSVLLILLSTAFVACNKESPDEKFARLMKKAEEFRAQEKWDEARISLMGAVEAKPSSAQAYYELAEIMLRLKNFGRAREYYQSAINQDPNHRDARLHLAAFLLAARQVEEAETHVQKLLDANPDDTDAMVMRSGIIASRKNYEEARKILEGVIAKDPKNATAIASLGDVALSEGKGEEAEKLFLKSLELKPDSEPVKLVLAELFMKQGRLDEAQTMLETLVASSPENTSLRFHLGEFLLLRGAGDKAVEQYREMVKTDELRHDARDRMYDFALLKRDIDGARALTKELKTKHPSEPGTLYFEGRDAELDGKLDEALEYYSRAMQGLPMFGSVFRRAGILELQAGKNVEGVEHLNQAIAIDPRDVGARLAIARHNFASKDLGAAKDQVDKILQMFPRQLGANILRADIALVEGDLKSAENVYLQLADGLPNNPLGFFKLAVLEEQRKNPDAAIEKYRKVLTFDRDVLSPGRRLAQLVAGKEGLDSATKEIEKLRDASKNGKAEYSLILGSLVLSKRGITKADVDRARSLFQEAIDSKPTLFQGYFALAALDVMSGQADSAISNYEKLVELQPKQIPPRMLLALTLERAKRYAEAAEQYKAILDLSPRFAPAANNLAWLMVAELNGNLEEALRLAQIAKEELPEVSNVADTLGWIYYKRGSARAALPFLEHAVEIETRPGEDEKTRRINPEILFHLAVVQAETGDNAAAKKTLDQIVANSPEGAPVRGQAEELLKKIGA
jgi:tetratricopeptide (TPR) repeat protein